MFTSSTSFSLFPIMAPPPPLPSSSPTSLLSTLPWSDDPSFFPSVAMTTSFASKLSPPFPLRSSIFSSPFFRWSRVSRAHRLIGGFPFWYFSKIKVAFQCFAQYPSIAPKPLSVFDRQIQTRFPWTFWRFRLLNLSSRTIFRLCWLFFLVTRFLHRLGLFALWFLAYSKAVRSFSLSICLSLSWKILLPLQSTATFLSSG